MVKPEPGSPAGITLDHELLDVSRTAYLFPQMRDTVYFQESHTHHLPMLQALIVIPLTAIEGSEKDEYLEGKLGR